MCIWLSRLRIWKKVCAKQQLFSNGGDLALITVELIMSTGSLDGDEGQHRYYESK